MMFFDISHRQVREKGGKKASVIVILTDGVLLRPSDRKSFEKTDLLKQVKLLYHLVVP